jgi:hypothetical protein
MWGQRHILRDRLPSTTACPACWAIGDKGIEKVYSEKRMFFTGLTKVTKAKQNLLYQHDKPNKPTKESSLSFVLFEFPFASVSTVSRGCPSLVSLFGATHPLHHKRV